MSRTGSGPLLRAEAQPDAGLDTGLDHDGALPDATWAVSRTNPDPVLALAAVRGEGGALAELRVRFANAAAARVLGATPAALVGRTLRAALPEAEADALHALCARVVERGAPEERVAPWVPEPGGARWMEQHVAPLGDGVVVWLRDVTHATRAQAESARLLAALGQKQQLLEALLRQVPAGFMLVSPEGLVLEATAQMEELFGGPLCQPPTGTGPDEGLRRFADWASLPDGRPLAPEATPLWRSARGGERVQGQLLRLRRADGGTRTVEVSSAPILGADGQVLAAAAVLADVTELHGARESLEMLLAVVGHDLRTPLSAIRNSVASLARHPPGPEGSPEAWAARVQRTLSRVGRSAGRMEQLLAELMDAVRARHGMPLSVTPARLDLHALAAQAADEVEAAWPGRQVARELTGSPFVWADGLRLAQALVNLLQNAMTHGEPGAPVTLSAGTHGEVTVLSVHNLGPAIPPAALPALFEPFHRGADGSGTPEGMGLGLHIVRRVAEAHGGRVEVESDAARGTCFRVVIPGPAPEGA